MSVGKRLKEMRATKGLTQLQLCEILEIPQSNLVRYENDRGNLTYEKLQKIYQLGINLEWLIIGEGEMLRNGDNTRDLTVKKDKNLIPIDENLIKIPLLNIKASAGVGFVNYQEDVKDYIGIPARFLGGYLPKNVALLFADGDSMEPIMHSGDLLLVSPKDKELISERIYIIRAFDELRVKKLIRKINGNIIIKSENERYGSEEVSPQEWTDNNIEIVGRVINVIHAHSI